MTHLGIKGLSGRVADSSHGHLFPGEFDTPTKTRFQSQAKPHLFRRAFRSIGTPTLHEKMKIELHRFHLVGATPILGSFYPHHTGATKNVAEANCATNSKACVVSPV